MISMNKLQVFKNEQLKLEVGVIKNDDGSISVKLDDAARGLGFTQIKNDKEYIKWERVARYLEEYGVSPQVGKDDYIPESIFYLLAMKASNETAKQFQIWIAQDVIPSIRKNGKYEVIQDSYMIEDPIERAKRWIEEQEEKKQLELRTKQQEQQLIEQKPLVGFAQQVSDSSDCVDVGEFSKTIRDENIKMGRNNLFKWLKSNHYLMNNNNPYQKYINNGMFKVVEVVKKTPYGTKVFTKTLITGIGQIRLLEKIRESYGGNK